MGKGVTKIFSNIIKGGEKGSKFLTAGTVFNVGLNSYFAAKTYQDARSQGQGVIGSTISAASDFALGEILGFKGMLLYGAASALPKGIVAGAETMGKIERQMNQQSRLTPFANAHFNDYNQAFTMRQAGMQAAQQSKYNLQQALLGNEAQYLK